MLGKCRTDFEFFRLHHTPPLVKTGNDVVDQSLQMKMKYEGYLSELFDLQDWLGNPKTEDEKDIVSKISIQKNEALQKIGELQEKISSEIRRSGLITI